jgi:RimJ/RimL family protein N-acetyltransferase
MGAEIIDFYTIGLPRTRSLWLSKLLGYGDSTCFHEHLSAHSRQIKPDVDTKYRGFCDTNPLIDIDYGDSPVLIVKRPVEDVIRSGLNSFNIPHAVRSFSSFLSNYMDKYSKALDDLKPKNVFVVDFEDLSDPATISDICSFLMPGNEIPLDHINEMIHERIQTTNRELTASLEDTALSLGMTYDDFIAQYDKPVYSCHRIMDYRTAIQTMDAIWDDIAEDGAEQYKPDLIGEFWMGIYSGSEYLGMYRIHQITSVLWEIHAFILPEKRDHSVETASAILEWVNENIELRKLICNIPECFKNVIGFVKKVGFAEQGYNSDSYSKGGIIGMYQFGITAEQIRSQVESCQQQQQL